MYDAMMLDIGGTFVKYGGMQAERFACQGQFPIRQEGTRAEIIGALANFLRLLLLFGGGRRDRD